MFVFLNGQFVPEDRAVVSVFDRSFLYGDGLFETLRVVSGRPFRWRQHLDRFQRGAEFMHLRLPFPPAEMRQIADELLQRNQMSESLLRVHLSRGVGPRGYSPQAAKEPLLVMSLHPAPAMDVKNPPRWRLVTTSFRLLTSDPLAHFKTCNKLPQIMARAEAEARGADEGILLSEDGQVAEASSSNLFWMDDDVVFTPPLTGGILPGVTRAVVLEICARLGLATREAGITPDALRRTAGVFLSMSSLGVVEAVILDEDALSRSPRTELIRGAYEEILQEEWAG